MGQMSCERDIAAQREGGVFHPELKVLAATQGFRGTVNDKTIVKFDGLISAIHEGTRYANVEFDLCGSNGELIRERGLYVIVDGGYHKWRCLQCPSKSSISAEMTWSSWLESVRKDVECTFGTLKGRFRCLTLPCASV